jgi:hypothetical protein
MVSFPLFATATLNHSSLKSIMEIIDGFNVTNRTIFERYSIPIDENFYIRYDLTQIVQDNLLKTAWDAKSWKEILYLNQPLIPNVYITNQGDLEPHLHEIISVRYSQVLDLMDSGDPQNRTRLDWVNNQNIQAMWLPYVGSNYVLVKGAYTFELQSVSNTTCAVDNTCNGHVVISFDIYGDSLFLANNYGLATPVTRFNSDWNFNNDLYVPNTSPGPLNHYLVVDNNGVGLTNFCASCYKTNLCFRPDVPVHVLRQTSVVKVAVGSLQPGDTVIGEGRTSTVQNIEHFSTTDLACRVPPDMCGGISADIVVSKSHAVRCQDWPIDEWTFCQPNWERVPVTEYVHVELESYIDDHLLSGSIVLESWDGYTREADSTEDACSTRGCPWPHRYETVGLHRWRRVDLRQTLQHPPPRLRLTSM